MSVKKKQQPYGDERSLWQILLLLSGSSLAMPPALSQENFLILSSGTPPPLTNVNLAINNAGPGASAASQPPDTTGFNVSANLGDLSRVLTGLPAQTIVGLRVRGDRSYVLTASEMAFSVTNLQHRGINLQGSQDRGSFIRVTAGTPAGIGSNSNVSGSNVNGALAGEGLMLSQFANGGVGPSSTVIMFGSSPTVEKKNNTTALMNGTISSTSPTGIGPGTNQPGNQPGNGGQNNQSEKSEKTEDPLEKFGAVEVPLSFWVPTGLALGPVSGNTPGSFFANIQFGVFPRP